MGGRFTDRQRELFTIVRDAMDMARDKMRPGIETKESNQAVVDGASMDWRSKEK